MDESTQHQQETEDEIIAHVLFGATVFDLTLEQRLYVFRVFINHYLQGWPGNLPGFTPAKGRYDCPVQIHGTKDAFPRVMRLTSYGNHLLPARGRPSEQRCQHSLLLSDRGELLLEISTMPTSTSLPTHIKIKPCTDKRLARLLEDPLMLRSAIGHLRHHLVNRRHEAQRILDRVTELDALLSRVS